MLRWRIPIGLSIAAVVVGLCWLDHHAAVPGMWLLPLGVLFAVLASGEVLHMARAAGLRPLAWPVYLGNVLLVLSNWVPFVGCRLAHNAPLPWQVSLTGGHGLIWTWPLAALALGVCLLFVGEMARYQRPGGVLANLAVGVFCLVYVGVLLSFVVQLRMFWGIGALLSLPIVTKLGDTGAFFTGRLLGRHKMAPVLSPGKTIEGSIGGLVFACGGAWLALRWLVPLTAVVPAGAGTWWDWIVFGVLVGVAGMIGDLAESLLKRDVGVKDSSNWLPGLGGVLDILDSVLLAAPAAWFCWALGLVGK